MSNPWIANKWWTVGSDLLIYLASYWVTICGFTDWKKWRCRPITYHWALSDLNQQGDCKITCLTLPTNLICGSADTYYTVMHKNGEWKDSILHSCDFCTGLFLILKSEHVITLLNLQIDHVTFSTNQKPNPLIPKTSWNGNITAWTGLKPEQLMRQAEVRLQWRVTVHSATNPRTEVS